MKEHHHLRPQFKHIFPLVVNDKCATITATVVDEKYKEDAGSILKKLKTKEILKGRLGDRKKASSSTTFKSRKESSRSQLNADNEEIPSLTYANLPTTAIQEGQPVMGSLI